MVGSGIWDLETTNPRPWTPDSGVKKTPHLGSTVLVVLHRHRGGRTGNINAWYLNTHMVYL
jgi:hypothetical protein